MLKLPPCSCTDARRRRRGQAAIETSLLLFGVVVMIMGTWHLFQVTWAAQNANIRAREAVLHSTTYMTGARAGATSPGNTVWDEGLQNYRLAEPGTTVSFSASADDYTTDGYFTGQSITATATITE